jgi:OmpA-OmpF porin, OOP family
MAKRGWAVVFVLAVLAGACGGDDDDDASVAEGTSSTTTTEAPQTTSSLPTDEPDDSDDLFDAEGNLDADQDLVNLAAGALVVKVAPEGENFSARAVDGAPSFQAVGNDRQSPLPQEFVVEFPAMTTIEQFGVPAIAAGPQTKNVIATVEIEGSTESPDAGFTPIVTIDAQLDLETPQLFENPDPAPVRWLKVRAIERFESPETDTTPWLFAELYGFGTQDEIDSAAGQFEGKYRLRRKGINDEPGVNVIELFQNGPTITGCQNVGGVIANIEGTVVGGVAQLTVTPESSGPPFPITAVIATSGELSGVSFQGQTRAYYAAPDSAAATSCSKPETPPNPVSDALAACRTAIVHGINFDVNEATIRPDAEPVLATILEALEANPDVSVVIEGHTDADGSDDSNLDLSQRRAASVVRFLTDGGIDAARLVANGAGESQPIADNETSSGKALNRRVEVEPNC